VSKLKDGVNPGLVESIVEKYTEGVVVGWSSDFSIDDTVLEATGCLNMLKNSFYKA
jgi:hypothetical protein